MQLLLRLHIVCRRSDWKSVYLHGPSGVGKSTVLEKGILLCRLGRWQMSVPGNFFFGSFLRCEYDVVVFD